MATTIRLFNLLMLTATAFAWINSSDVVQASEADSNALAIEVLEDEKWWLGVTSMGHLMPLESPLSVNTVGETHGNQVQPLLLSSHGRYVWSNEGFQLDYDGQTIKISTQSSPLVVSQSGSTLKTAFFEASRLHFPPAGKLPNERLFASPQYNTWIELMYDQNEKDILSYARSIVENGLPPGVLMIDDNWQEDYGKWDFHEGRFSNPKKMVAELHSMGFEVMLWVSPFVSPDCDNYRKLESEGAFIKEKIANGQTGLPKIVRWWNGASALLDLSNPVDKSWFISQLDYLQEEYGVDGFKFDAGDASYYLNSTNHEGVSANEQCRLFGEIGKNYPLNEYRAMWQMGGQPLVQRLRDKGHNWPDLKMLIPQMCLQGLMGYPFSCPDMIGGGEFQSFLDSDTVDQELVVRSAQCHALMPMMQFSVAPWRVLNETHFRAVKKAVELRLEFTSYILSTAKQSAASGEPSIRPMEYEYPRQGYENICDQFLIGTDLLVAPVLEQGATVRNIQIPPGSWTSATGEEINGPEKISINVKLGDLPYYQRVVGSKPQEIARNEDAEKRQ